MLLLCCVHVDRDAAGIGTGGNKLAQFYAGLDIIWQF